MLQNKKSLGQHWLKDRATLDEIASLASSEAETCVEIGPGLGTLTSSLLRVFPKVIAIEFDEKLASNLPKSFPGKNLQVINEDFLKFDLNSINTSYVVTGNIPYYITSPIILKLLETKKHPEKIVLLIQKEVAERICAKAGDHSVLSLTVQNLSEVGLGPVVPRDLFTPPPKVDSQVIILTPRETPVVDEKVIGLIKRGFNAPRKKLIKNLGQISKDDMLMVFESIGISKDARPADLTLEDWKKLLLKLSKTGKM